MLGNGGRGDGSGSECHCLEPDDKGSNTAGTSAPDCEIPAKRLLLVGSSGGYERLRAPARGVDSEVAASVREGIGVSDSLIVSGAAGVPIGLKGAEASGCATVSLADGVVIAEAFVAAADAAFEDCEAPGADCEALAIGIVVAV